MSVDDFKILQYLYTNFIDVLYTEKRCIIKDIVLYSKF